jgi:hypothetical protein
VNGLKRFKTFAKEFIMKKTWELSLKSDHGGKFKNESFKTVFNENDISHNFSCPRKEKIDLCKYG